MAYQFIDTPRTDPGNRTHMTAGNLSFSEVQASPSKDPARDLLRQSRRDNRTPQSRNVLGNIRNPSTRNEFTPLLKSAARNRYKASSRLQSHNESDENNTSNDLVNSMLAAGQGAPTTPAYLRSAYKNTRGTPALPIESSVIEGDSTRNSMDTTPLPPAVSSSAMLSSPMPVITTTRASDRADRKDVLTLRQQEVKLEKLDKENFALKLKIHFLDDMLAKTGTDYQQEIIKQNTELKVEKTTLTQDIRQQAKRLARADKELLEYKQQLHEYAEKVKKRHTSEIVKEEMDRLREAVDESNRLVEARDREVDSLQHKLELAERGSGDKAQELRDEIADLEMDLRSKDEACDERDEQIESLQHTIKTLKTDQDEAKTMEQDIADMEGELDERDQQITDLKSQLHNAGDREKSTRKLRFDVGELETRLRDKDALLDERDEELRRLRKKGEEADTLQSANLRQLQGDLHDRERLLQQKSDEAQALQERLDTARGSWDAEAQQTDARLQERNNVLHAKETELRQALHKLDERSGELKALQQQIQTLQQDQAMAVEQHAKTNELQARQVSELQDKLRNVNADFDKEADARSVMLQAKDEEIRRLEVCLQHDRPEAESQRLSANIDRLERQIQEHVQQRTIAEQESKILRERLERAGSPSKRETIIAQQAEDIHRLERLCEDRDGEIEVLDNDLADAEALVDSQKAELARLQDRNGEGDRNQLLRSNQTDVMTKMASVIKSLQNDKASLKDEIEILEETAEQSQTEIHRLQSKVGRLESELSAMRASMDTVMTPGRERGELRQRLRDAESKHDEYRQQIQTLEGEVDRVSLRARSATPMREHDSLKQQLSDANNEIKRLEERMALLETRSQDQSTSKTGGRGQDDELRGLLRDAKIEVDNLQLQIREQDKRITTLMRKEGESRLVLSQTRMDLEERATALDERDQMIAKLTSKERDLRAQIVDLKSSRARLQELEAEGKEGDEQTTQHHDRVEQHLRARLRDTRADNENLRCQVVEQQQQQQQRRHQQQQSEAKTLTANGGTAGSMDKIHEKELRGLAKQIQYLRAKCGREEGFRRDLIFAKDWFQVQIAMYNECNKADLRLLEEMGITPASRSARLDDGDRRRGGDGDGSGAKRHVSLRSVAWATIATHRMKKKSAAWAGNRKVHESLLRKLDGMKQHQHQQ